MSKWFERHPDILYAEADQLASTSSYEQQHHELGNLFVSAGNILVRANGRVERFPVAIVYAEATPYDLPKVFLLDQPLTESDVKILARLTCDAVAQVLQQKARFYFKRHQNPDGSLCLLEQDNLDRHGAEFYDARSIIRRVQQWLTAQLLGRPMPESQEVELYAHYPHRLPVHILLTAAFYIAGASRGHFYLLPVPLYTAQQDHQLYIGAGLVSDSAPTDETINWPHMPEGLRTPQQLTRQPGKLRQALKDNKLVEGYWWSLPGEPPVFADGVVLLQYLTDNLPEGGQPAELLWKPLKDRRDYIFVGLCFPNRHAQPEWLLLTLERTGNQFKADYARRNVPELLRNYRLASCYSEAFRDQDYHLRNSGRVSYEAVRGQAVTVVGCGALGSEIADSLGKAGVGHLKLVDNQTQYPHNSIRHLAGLHLATLPKAVAVAQVVADHNPFVKLDVAVEDILRGEFAHYMLPAGIGICSIAEDNTEAYLNEQAIAHQRTMFYARALRGGKAARIFRIIPGVDACFHCLTLYRREQHEDFVDVPEDTALPTLRNECNNPIRPASAADLKLISALTSRLLLDYLQSLTPTAPNHWVWATEPISGLPEQAGVPFSLHTRSLLPHPDCPYCQALHRMRVLIEPAALDFMRQLTLATPGVETGGILIGKISAGLVHVQYASPPGPGAVRTPMRFERDVESCQQFLNGYAAQGLLYLGEWHSHPDENNNPSTTDLTSLARIAQQPQYLTTKPIMLIFTRSGQVACTVHPVSATYYLCTLETLATTVENTNQPPVD
ncbi:hypothetical protein GCM10028824_43360 [Hymenobacter segetis]|uniref:ThiF family adenylyltransferase n=1 Tax=Hymenobacter segetis TaxID=2025509 RepID=A0ABU9LVT9_9BACT